MKFLEKDLEEIIFNSPREELKKRGLTLNGKIKRQLKIGNYGIADLVTFQRTRVCWLDHLEDGKQTKLYNYLYHVTIYELKKDKISMSAFLQAVRYAKGIQDYFYTRKISSEVEFHIHIIGKEISDTDFIYLPQICRNVTFTKFSYDLNGILFEDIDNYLLTNKGF